MATTSETVAQEWCGCPHCGETEELATIKIVRGSARCSVAGGEDDPIIYEGPLMLNLDAIHLCGIECLACGWAKQL